MPTDPQAIAYSYNAAPDLPPEAHVANGQSIDAGSAIDNAQSLAAFGDATQQIARMQELNSDEQRQAWNSISGDQQSMLIGAGYKAPKAPGRSAWSRTWHDVLGAPSALYRLPEKIPYVGDTIKQIHNAVGEAGSVALDALQSGNEFVKHVERIGAYDNAVNSPNSPLNKVPFIGGIRDVTTGAADTIDMGAKFVGNFLHLTDQSDWADAWNRTNRGANTFNPNKVRDVQASSGYDDVTMGLAKAVAASDKDTKQFLAEQLKAGMDPADVGALENKVNDPAFQKYVGQLKDARFSFGRSMVPDWMWQKSPFLAHLYSASGDAVFSFADPFIVGSKVNKVAKVARYGFKTAEELDAALAKPAAIAYRQDVVDALKKGPSVLLDRHPELAPVLEPLAQANPTNIDDITKLATPTSTDGIMTAFQESQMKSAELKRLNDFTDALNHSGLADVKTQEEFANWQKENFYNLHVMGGRGTAISHGENLVQTLTPVGKAFLDAKGIAKKKIDWMADFGRLDGGNPIKNALPAVGEDGLDVGPGGFKDLAGRVAGGPIRLVGTTAKRLTTIVPRGMTFDPADPKSIVAVRDFSRAYLTESQTNRLVNDYALANTIAAKRAVYIDMLNQTFRAAGLHLTDDNPLMNHFINVVSQTGVTQKYAANGIDTMMTAGRDSVAAHGISEADLTERWSLPGFNELMANQKRGQVNKLLYSIPNNAFAQTFNLIWKPLQLLRMGFPVRVSMEELAGATARNGVIPMAKAALTSKAIEGTITNGVRSGFAAPGTLADLNPIEAGVSRALRMIPKSWWPNVDSPEKLQAMLLNNRMHRAIKWAAGKAPGVERGIQIAMQYPEHYEGQLSDEISALHTSAKGFANDGVDANQVFNGMKRTTLGPMRATGDYKEIKNGDDFYPSTWMHHLDKIANSGLYRTVLKSVADGHDVPTTRGIVADYIQSPEFKKYWDSAYRGTATRDGRQVGYDATERQAAEDWAHVAMEHVSSMLPKATDESSQHFDDMVKTLLKNKQAPHLQSLNKIPFELRPDAVTGQEFIEVPTGGPMGVFKEFVNKGFARMGGAMNTWSRQPMHLASLIKAHEDLEPVVQHMLGDTPMAKELLHALVNERVNAETLPFIHDPSVRSQMNVLTGTLAPFQFAQEQFWKRWAKTFIHSPEAMREAALAHHSLGATGFTHKDESGAEIFTYPLSGFAQKAVTDGLSAFGIDASLPVQQAFTGQLKMVAPGLDRTFAPSYGPLVSVPLTLLTAKFHELAPLEHAALGDIGTGRPLWAQVFPATVTRIVAAIDPNAAGAAYGNAQMRAIQDLYATGHGLPPNASDADREQFMNRVKNWTRINFAIRAGFGFGAPAAPSLAIGDTKFGHELRLLSESGLDFTKAMQVLTERNPDAFPYTVFESRGVGSATLPATEAAAKMLSESSAFFKKHNAAGGFFLPTKSDNDKFSSQAYQEQLLNLMRVRKSPSEFLDNLMFAQASTDYFDTRDAYNLAVKNLHGSSKDAVTQNFQAWKAQYFHDHPVFAREIQSTQSVQKRAATLEDLKKALNDPTVPSNDQTTQIRDLTDTYAAYKDQVAQYAGMNSQTASNARTSAKVHFAGWAKKYVQDNPGALDVYNRLIRPDVDPDGISTTGA